MAIQLQQTTSLDLVPLSPTDERRTLRRCKVEGEKLS